MTVARFQKTVQPTEYRVCFLLLLMTNLNILDLIVSVISTQLVILIK